MTARLQMGRIAGVPVTVHWSAGLIVLLVAESLALATLPQSAPGYPKAAYWLTAVAGSVAFLGCLFAHELAHALVAKRMGVHVERISLWLLGGIAQLGGQAPNPRADFAVAAVGPATSLVCAGGFWLAALAAGAFGWGRLAFAALAWLAVFNGIIAGFNLLPGAPLDGGRVLRALLWWRGGDRERAATRAAQTGVWVGSGVALFGWIEILVGAFGGLWFLLIGLFLAAAARAEANASRLAGVTVTAAEVMTRDPVCAPGWYTLDAFFEWNAGHGQRPVYPVIDFDGRPVGVIALDDLARGRALPGYTRVQDAATPLRRVPVLRPGDSAAPLLSRPRLAAAAGTRLCLVIDEGRLVGAIDVSTLPTVIRLHVQRRNSAQK
jgi:Zn-dependent protease